MRHKKALFAFASIIAFSPLLTACISSHELPPQENISQQAKDEIAFDKARGPAPLDLKKFRERDLSIQYQVGDKRLARLGVKMEDSEIDGVKVRIFTPKNVKDDKAIFIDMHGGGFMTDAGSITENVHIAAQTGWKVVSVLYTMSPEVKFPVARDETIKVYNYLRKENPNRKIGLYGTSAGAILGAEVIAALKNDNQKLPDAFGFFSGSADYSKFGDSFLLFGSKLHIDIVKMNYLGGQDEKNVLISPQLGNLSGWPPTLCISSTRDILLSATADFCRKLDEDGSQQKFIVFEGMPHAFWNYIESPETEEAFKTMTNFFNKELGQ